MLGCRRCSLFLLGAGIGAVAGLLLAPKPGREIREELFGGSPDIAGAPGAGAGASSLSGVKQEQNLKARIEETRARLKADIEAQKQD